MRVTRATTIHPPALKIPFQPSVAKATWTNGKGGAAGGRTTGPTINLAVQAPASADLRTKVEVKGRVVTVTVGGNALPGNEKPTTRKMKLDAPMLNGAYTLVVKNESGKVLSRAPFTGRIPC